MIGEGQVISKREAKDERARRWRDFQTPFAAIPAFPRERLIASLRLQERHEFE